MFFQNLLKISLFSSQMKKRKNLKALLSLNRSKRKLKMSELITTIFVTKFLSMQSMTLRDSPKSEWWFQVESLEWTLKAPRQMDLFQWLICWITRDQSKQLGLISMKREDLSLKRYMTSVETKKSLTLMAKSVTQDFSLTMVSLCEIMMLMRSRLKCITIQQINWLLSKRKWLKTPQNSKSLEWARIFERTQCKNSSHGYDLLSLMMILSF